jgi:DNA-binding NtrC family response regulator
MLIADRFIALDGRTIDLASGQPVRLRKWPPTGVRQELAWSERCAILSGAGEARGHAAPSLVDYGVLAHGERFGAFRIAARGAPDRTMARDAQRARRQPGLGGCGPIQIYARQAADLFETACFGEPRCLRLWLPAAATSLAVLDAIARQARLNGFVPISVDLLVNAERSRAGWHARLSEILDTRHVLLIARVPPRCDGRGWCAPRGRIVSACPVGVARLLVAVGLKSARPNVLLIASHGSPDAGHVPAACDCIVGPAAHEAAGAFPAEVERAFCASSVAAEAREPYQVTRVPDLVRVRARAADAIDHARGGPAARAEHGLRDAMGALARREDAAGAAWVALNLGCLLLHRGRALDAARTFDTARLQFDRANDLPGAVRAAVYVGLAWTDDARLTEAEAAFRTAGIAAREAGLSDLQLEAGLGLARCLFWQGRFDEATVVVGSVGDAMQTPAAGAPAGPRVNTRYPSGDTDGPIALVREAQVAAAWGAGAASLLWHGRSVAVAETHRSVRLACLSSRIALARGDVRAASAQATRALEAAGQAARPIDVCAAHTALARVYGALNDVDALLDHVREGLRGARRAQAPPRALRLRLIACDNLRRAGREREAARLLERLASLDAGRFAGLLRMQLQMVVGADAKEEKPGAREPGGPPSQLAACPWRLPPRRAEVTEDIVTVLQACHDIEDEEAALARVCETVRERTRAVAVALVGRNGGAPAVLARSGPGAGRSTLANRVLDTGLSVPACGTPLGLEAASPVSYAGGVIGAVVCRWPADALVEAGRVACLLSAAAAATAPHVRSLLDRRDMPHGEAAEDEAQLVGVSDAIQALRKAAQRAAAAPFPVLIEGESGSGKELVARAVHRDSARRLRRFCALNCAALTDELLEAELFGHVRGAFTGAVGDRIGLFEEADGGTLFLDEVADLSPRAQAKLLRAVQEGEVRRLGENFARHVDARVIAATNRRLDVEVTRGAFRRDLFYRLNVVHIDVPALRDRPEDIPLLASHFWQRSVARIGSHATLAPQTMAVLAGYDWPGNVRELQNVMAALAVSAPRRGSVGPLCLPAAIARAETVGATLDEARRLFERRFVRAAVARAGGHRGRAAASLGISRQGLAKLMARLALDDPGEAAG